MSMGCGASSVSTADATTARATAASPEQARVHLSGATHRLIVLNGPSGSGKSTLFTAVRALPEFEDRFGFSASHTTRGPRPGEVDGREYHYVTHEQFAKLAAEGGFLETAQVHTNRYGTSFQAVASVLTTHHCVLDIDYKGSRSLKAALPPDCRALFVFVSPPSLQIMEQRLRGRGSETEEQIATRMRTAHEEMDFLEHNRGFYDAVVVNDDLGTATNQLADKIRSFLAE